MALTNASTAASLNKTECHLLRLPAELRNEIFLLALGAGELVNVTATRWPGITGTCKQIRAETLPIYLGSGEFVAEIEDLNDWPLLQWLSNISALTVHEKRLIKSVTIACTGDILEPISSGNGVEIWPNFGFWDNIVAQIQVAGLTASQVSWAGMDVERFRFEEEVLMFEAPMYLFHNFVLKLLLRTYQLEDGSCEPVNVAAQIAGSMTSAAHPWTEQMATAWAMQYPAEDPENWYVDWVRQGEDSSAS